MIMNLNPRDTVYSLYPRNLAIWRASPAPAFVSERKVAPLQAKDIEFKVGDKVLLYDETMRRRRSKKLDSLWAGPYTVW